MSNDHAQDRYDPPNVGSDFEQQIYGDIVQGEIFRIEHLRILLKSIVR